MSCTRARFPESTTTGKNVGGMYTISAATATRDIILWRRRKLVCQLSSAREDERDGEEPDDHLPRDDAHRRHCLYFLCVSCLATLCTLPNKTCKSGSRIGATCEYWSLEHLCVILETYL
jgi:hypothetical protein